MRILIRIEFFILLIISAPILAQVPAADNLTGNANINMNWIISTSYDNSGNVLSQGKNFFDNSGTLLQTQSKKFYRSNSTTVYTHVLATQPIKDAYGRQVLTTLPAPIDYADFNFDSTFVLAPDNSNYKYKNFDRFNPSGTEIDKTNSPDQIGSQQTKGTLGWYYGPYNTWEPYTATDIFPYSRTTIYKDGSNNKKSQASVGNSFVTGWTNHQASSYITSVSNELNHYLQVRNKFFATTNIGSEPNTILGQVMQVVSRDVNGNEAIVINDKAGKTLMAGRPGSDLVQTPTVVTLNALPNTLTLPTAPSGSGCSLGSQFVLISGSGTNFTLTNPSNFTVSFSGPVNNYSQPVTTTDWGAVIRSNQPFSVVYTDYQTAGVCTPVSTQLVTQSSSTALSSSIYYFKILADNTPVSITSTGTFTLYDMSNELGTSLIGGNSLNRGYYKLVANTGSVSLSYSNSFSNVSYNFYNSLGQLVASIAPNGVKLLLTNGLAAYSSLLSVPFVTTYTYDAQCRLVNSTSPDAGTSYLVYRKDGKIRFSQNAYQASRNRFSYTNYDPLGRPIESGEYNGPITFNSDPSVVSTMQSILEDVSPTGGLTASGGGTEYDVVHTTYDIPDNSHGQAGYIQDPANLGGKISFTSRYGQLANFVYSSANLISQTWFNYDEEGKLVWQIKYIASLGTSGFKTADFTYDPLSRLVKRVFQKNTAAETFVHYFTYDAANGNLLSVSTNTQDLGVGSASLQATYKYYLHGGLKRVELGGNAQGLDYVYTLQGALKSINNSNNTSTSFDPGNDAVGTTGFYPDAFGEVLDYYTNDYNNTRTTGVQKIYGVNNVPASDSWTGNIKAMTWYSSKTGLGGGSSLPVTYLFSYDPKYQFVGSTWGNALGFASNPATYTTTTINQEKVFIPSTTTPAYDLNGNIQYLQRTDVNGASTDILAYNYFPNTNKLSSVANTGSSAPAAYTYGYDQTGRETSETTGTSATTKYLQYDVTGKVVLVATDAAFTQPVAKFVYDETGKRIEKISYNASYQPILATYYYEDVVYAQPIVSGVPGTLSVQEYQVSGNGGRLGIYYKQLNLYTYELKDHLGNIRAIIAKTGVMQKATDYYPFGMMISTFGTGYRYGYQGQTAEADGETGWNSFELRMYNPRIARWMTIDPKGQFFSPYTGIGNNPTSGIDKNGGSVDDIIFTGTDGHTIVIKAPGDDIYVDVPFDLKSDQSYTFKDFTGFFDPQRLATGYTNSVSVNGAVGAGKAYAAELTYVNFYNKDYEDYTYVYAGTSNSTSLGNQINIGANLGYNIFIAYNTQVKPNYNPLSFEGETTFQGYGQDVKDVFGVGWNIQTFSMNSGWVGLSLGLSGGVGGGANLGSIFYGSSNSILLNDVMKTQDRSPTDKLFNSYLTTATALTQYIEKTYFVK